MNPYSTWEHHLREREAFLQSYDTKDNSAAAPDEKELPIKPPGETNTKPPHKKKARKTWQKILYNLRLRNAALEAQAAARFRKKTPPPSSQKPIRVLRIIDNPVAGGVAKDMNQTLLRISPEEAETHIIAFGPPETPSPRISEQPHIHFHTLPMQLWTGSWDSILFQNIHTLRHCIHQINPDILHLHGPVAATATAIANAGQAPLLIHLHSAYSTRRKKWHPLHAKMEKNTLRKAHLLAHSPGIESDARKWLDLPTKKIHLIEDGANDLPLWRSNPAIEAWTWTQADQRPIALLTARVLPLKRVQDFFEACHTLNKKGKPLFPVALLYAAEKKETRQQIEETFYSHFQPGQGEIFYNIGSPRGLTRMATMAISCSTVEGLPKSILEYMAEGCPVIATDIPAHRELIDPGKTGLLYPVADTQALTAAIEKLLDQPSLRTRLSQAARASTAPRRWETTARQTLQAYRSILANHS